MTKRTRDFAVAEYSERWEVCRGKPNITEARMATIRHAVADPGEVITDVDNLDMVYRGQILEGVSAMVCLQLQTVERMRIFQGLLTRGFRFCELGCGIGWNLSHFPPGTRVYGGEIVEPAIEVAREHNMDVVPFDFYDVASYSIVRPDSVVFTVHAIEQLPDATPFLAGMRSVGHRVHEVWHFEPYWIPRAGKEAERNQYLRDRDYNQNLGRLLREAEDVEVIHEEHDVHGAHWHNVQHVIGWRFK